MSARKQSTPEGVPADEKAVRRKPAADGTRETVEAIAIAFVLAFLFKTFEAEAYVIPTGSMAPTLYGRHKEVVCSGCGHRYAVGASHEIEQDSGVVQMRIATSECPNCRCPNDIHDAVVYNGDRILVNKQVSQYKRFDVVVFKNPEEPRINYIKRLVGMPGETVRIRQGDLYARRTESDPWRIQRKEDPWRQKDIQLIVYDDRHPPRLLLNAGLAERWVPATNASQPERSSGENVDADRLSALLWQPSENAWQPDAENRRYSAETTDGSQHWLRYRNLVPSPEDWMQVASQHAAATDGIDMQASPADAESGSEVLEPSLIVDFCGFNSFSADTSVRPYRSYDDGLFWVGDLTLNATVSVQGVSPGARLTFELVEGHRSYRCEISPETGQADLYLTNRLIDADAAEPELCASAATSLRGTGQYAVAMANVDDRICLWVAGELVEFGSKAEFNLTEPSEPTAADLTPAGIAVTNMQATVSELLLQRDIYYRNDTVNMGTGGRQSDVGYGDGSHHTIYEIPQDQAHNLATNLKSPENYARLYFELTRKQLERYGDAFDYRLNADEYLMCGDNSPASKDSRLFDYYSRPMRGQPGHRHAVRGADLIGEAFLIFWPHGVPFLNGGEGFTVLNHLERTTDGGVKRGEYPLYRAPFYPNISRMKKIR